MLDVSRKILNRTYLYGVTDISSENEDVLKQVEAAYQGGADIIQLRSKKLCDGALYRLGLRMRSIADAHDKTFLVNDRLDIALAVNADGVHLGQDDLPVEAARKMLGAQRDNFIIGKSTHSLQQAREAVRQQVDYFGVGPIYTTPTKKDYAAVGLDLITQVSQEKLPTPFFAIGGIDEKNIQDVMKAGAYRVAVVRAIFNAADVRQQANDLRRIIDEFSRSKN